MEQSLPDDRQVHSKSGTGSAEFAEEQCTLDGSDEGIPAHRNWLDRAWVWPLFGLVAVLIFELTANVGLAVAVFCAKLGLRDIRLGWWLYRRDPIAERGAITGLIAASMIGLKVTIASLLTMVTLVVLAAANPLNWNPGPALKQCAVSLGVTTSVCLLISLLISTAGFLWVLRAGQRVWLDGTMLRAPQQGEWPPLCDGPSTRNSVIDIAQLGFLLQLPVIVGVGSWMMVALGLQFPGIAPWLAVAMLAALIASYIYLRTLISRVVARRPLECWPELDCPPDDFPEFQHL